MIIGIGHDICDVKRIGSVLLRYRNRFTHRLFSDYERNYADKKPLNSVVRYAQFFAAKEACAKALGTGIAKGVYWQDLEVCHDEHGVPILRLHNTASDILHARAKILADKHKISSFTISSHLTLSSDAFIASAVIILELIEHGG